MSGRKEVIMEMRGKIVKRGDKYVFIPMEAMPGEEELFPSTEAQAITVRPVAPRPYTGPVRPTQTPLTPPRAEQLATEQAKEAIKAAAAARRGLLITREGASVSRGFYHKKSYSTDFAGKSRVMFYDREPDPDGLITNIPEPYFKSPITFIGMKIDIEPSILRDVDDAYKYEQAIQALTRSIVIIRVNDTNVYTLPFKDLAPIVDTKITSVGNERHTIFEFEPSKIRELGDLIKANYISISSKDKLSLIIVTDESFPKLGTGAVDFMIIPYLYGRATRRIIGG